MEETEQFDFDKELEDAGVLADRYVEFYNGLLQLGSGISEDGAKAMTIALIRSENALPSITTGGTFPPLTGAN